MSEWWDTDHATDTCRDVPLCAGARLGTPEACADPGLWRMRLLKEALLTLASPFSGEVRVWWLVGFPVFVVPLQLLSALRPPAPFMKTLAWQSNDEPYYGEYFSANELVWQPVSFHVHLIPLQKLLVLS